MFAYELKTGYEQPDNNFNMKGHCMEDFLQVGIIATTHGVRGEVKVYPTTDDITRFKKLKEVILDTGREKLTMEVEEVKFFKQMVILKFRGVDTLDEVTGYRRAGLYVTRDNAVKLEKDEYFIADLIGVEVYDESEKLFGRLADVITTGANDVYVIRMSDGGELLLPAIKQCILEVDLPGRRMKVHVLEGLL